MSENRFLQTFYAVAASAVLVCSTMLFLVATSDWGHPTGDMEASVPTRVDVAQLSTRSEVEPVARLPIDPPSPPPLLASDQADSDYTASTPDLPEVAEPDTSLQPEASAQESDADLATRGTPLSSGPADAPSAGRDPATEADAIASGADEDASPEVTIAEPSQSTSPVAGDTSKAASVEQAAPEAATPPAAPQMAEVKIAEPSQPTTPIAGDASKAISTEPAATVAAAPPAPAPATEAKVAEPSQSTIPVASDERKAATVEQATTEAATPSAAPQMAEAKIVELSQPTSTVASDESNAATVEQATTEAATPPASPQMAEAKVVELSQPTSPVASDVSKAASGEQATTQAAKPPAIPKVAKAGPPPKVARAQPQEASSQPRGKAPWKAMSLAPADKPSISLSKAPTSRPSASGYRSKVWSALARHKPKAGQRGSATVIFAIGESGGLRFVRVGSSSGNKRLDQLALATVRNAAPYPAPPGGAQSFTIRIDFH